MTDITSDVDKLEHELLEQKIEIQSLRKVIADLELELDLIDTPKQRKKHQDVDEW